METELSAVPMLLSSFLHERNHKRTGNMEGVPCTLPRVLMNASTEDLVKRQRYDETSWTALRETNTVNKSLQKRRQVDMPAKIRTGR